MVLSGAPFFHRRRCRGQIAPGAPHRAPLTGVKKYGMVCGMAIMTHRTTFALDDATVTRIRRLAAQWQVSQAEVIRRVVASTNAAVNPDPVAMLDALHRAGGGLTAEEAESHLTTVRGDRQHWRGR